MKLIFAQGNPGSDYAKTRHNIGFMAVDNYAAKNDMSFAEKSKFNAYIAEGQVGDERIILAKPTTYYNETGRSARAIVDFYKLDPEQDVLVIHDDIALPLGMLRIRNTGSGAGNNGIKSLNAHLGPTYWRLRVGIYNELRDRMHDADFVLKNFSKSELATLDTGIVPEIGQQITNFCNQTFEATSIDVSVN